MRIVLVSDTMDGMKLNEQEQRLYSELFAHCDVENTGKIQGIRVSELFFSTGINKESLNQVKFTILTAC